MKLRGKRPSKVDGSASRGKREDWKVGRLWFEVNLVGFEEASLWKSLDYVQVVQTALEVEDPQGIEPVAQVGGKLRCESRSETFPEDWPLQTNKYTVIRTLDCIVYLIDENAKAFTVFRPYPSVR